MNNQVKDRILREGLGMSSSANHFSLLLNPLLGRDMDWKACALVAAHQLAVTNNMLDQVVKEYGEYVPRQAVEFPTSFTRETPAEVARRALGQGTTSPEMWQLMQALAVKYGDTYIFSSKEYYDKKTQEMIVETRGAEANRKKFLQSTEVVTVSPKGNRVILTPRKAEPGQAVDMAQLAEDTRTKEEQEMHDARKAGFRAARRERIRARVAELRENKEKMREKEIQEERQKMREKMRLARVQKRAAVAEEQRKIGAVEVGLAGLALPPLPPQGSQDRAVRPQEQPQWPVGSRQENPQAECPATVTSGETSA